MHKTYSIGSDWQVMSNIAYNKIFMNYGITANFVKKGNKVDNDTFYLVNMQRWTLRRAGKSIRSF